MNDLTVKVARKAVRTRRSVTYTVRVTLSHAARKAIQNGVAIDIEGGVRGVIAATLLTQLDLDIADGMRD